VSYSIKFGHYVQAPSTVTINEPLGTLKVDIIRSTSNSADKPDDASEATLALANINDVDSLAKDAPTVLDLFKPVMRNT
jgi:hypothetical protein